MARLNPGQQEHLFNVYVLADHRRRQEAKKKLARKALPPENHSRFLDNALIVSVAAGVAAVAVILCIRYT